MMPAGRQKTSVGNMVLPELLFIIGKRSTEIWMLPSSKDKIVGRGNPAQIRVDYDPEFMSQAFVKWCKKMDIKLNTFNQENLYRMLLLIDLTGYIGRMFWMHSFLERKVKGTGFIVIIIAENGIFLLINLPRIIFIIFTTVWDFSIYLEFHLRNNPWIPFILARKLRCITIN